jgi:DNA-binding transcriptional regulator YiaG
MEIGELMPNIGALLKSEITRLSRKEAKTEADELRKASARYRRDIAALKKQVAELDRAVKRLSGVVAKGGPSISESAASDTTSARFSPKGLVSTRKRLGLSQGGLAALLGVSLASIFNYEKGVTRPRPEVLHKIVALRSVSKAQVDAHLSH